MTLSISALADATGPQLVPMPAEMTTQEGSISILPVTQIVIPENQPEFKLAAEYLAERLSTVLGCTIGSGDNSLTPPIIIKADATLAEEGYTLTVTTSEISITAKTGRGAFWGIQTLLQLLPPEVYGQKAVPDITLEVPCVTINDAPRFPWRGMHLDVSRHFATPGEVKQYIDLLAMNKMNTFHWHLTDDQGWRVEIKKYPELTTTGATRSATPIPANPRTLDGETYGPRFYKQHEIKSIVEHARKRFVTVVPEIELPGHSVAAMTAYPELGCTGKDYVVRCFWGIDRRVFCAGKDSTFGFLMDVFDEILPMFPGKYIHIGGDECPKDSWKKCPLCQKRMEDNGLKDEDQLQSYFIGRIEKYLNSKGKQIIGWDEILEGGLAPNAAVMSWRGVKGGIAAAKQKHNVIMSPSSHCYFDYYQASNKIEPPAIGGYLPLKRTYSYEPIPAELTEAEAKYILGVQGNVWTEYMPTFKKMTYMAYPRGCAIAEIGWTDPSQKNYDGFVERLAGHLKRFDACGANYRKLQGDEHILKKPGKKK